MENDDGNTNFQHRLRPTPPTDTCIYVMHWQDRLLLSQLRLTSLQFGWNKEPKGSNWSRPSELVNRTPPSKSDMAQFGA